MKRGLVVTLLVAAIVIAVSLAGVALSRRAVAQEPSIRAGHPRGDVVMLRCGTSGRFVVAAYQGSTGAPTKKSDQCPQALSDLLKDGFKLDSRGYDHEAETVVFTLMR